MATTAGVGHTWLRIERWFEANLPGKPLPGGADKSVIEQVEQLIGARFPEALEELYGIHNGSNGIFICKAGFLMPLIPGAVNKEQPLLVPSVSEMWSEMRNLLETGAFDPEVASHPKGPIKHDWWNPKWLPIVDNETGNNVCVDLLPEQGGMIGQVIDWSHEVGAIEVLANNLGDWLASVAEDLEQGRYRPSL